MTIDVFKNRSEAVIHRLLSSDIVSFGREYYLLMPRRLVLCLEIGWYPLQTVKDRETLTRPVDIFSIT
jgi:hypothetical protein